jgi:hypothetical protein
MVPDRPELSDWANTELAVKASKAMTTSVARRENGVFFNYGLQGKLVPTLL